MSEIIEFILANYTWLLGVAIIILLAIIGSYADKTNFGQGKQIEQDNKNEEIIQQDSEEVLDTDSNVNVIEEEENTKETEKDLETVSDEKDNYDAKDISLNNNEEEKQKEFDRNFEEFNEEFEEFLPEKEVIDGDLLDEIEGLSLDKTQKIKLSDIPDLDDVELPKIKNLKSIDDDIWKF